MTIRARIRVLFAEPSMIRRLAAAEGQAFVRLRLADLTQAGYG